MTRHIISLTNLETAQSKLDKLDDDTLAVVRADWVGVMKAVRDGTYLLAPGTTESDIIVLWYLIRDECEKRELT